MKKILLTLLFSFAFGAHAEPLKIFVPYGPGGNVDLQARIYAKELANLGVENVVLNRTGGDGMVGIRAAALAKPDGNNILYTCNGSITQKSAEHTGNREVVKQLIPVYKTMTIGQLFVTKKGSKITNWEELQAAIKSRSVSIGTSSGIMKDAVLDSVGIHPNVILVPFQGDVQTYAGVLSNVVDVGTVTMVWAPKAETGELNIIAVTSDKGRYGVKSLKERGYDVATSQYCGFWAPPGASDEVVKNFYNLIDRAQKSKEVDHGIRTVIHGLPAEPISQKAFADEIEAEYQNLLKRNSAKIAKGLIRP